MSRAAFFLGKGGVGKTTCALALSRVRSRDGPVLAASLDPAHNLAELAGAHPAGGTCRLSERLELCEPDLEEMARRRASESVELVRSSYRHLDALGLGRVADLLEHAPGMQEQSAVEALASFDARLERGGLLVVDMPPTGLAVRTLALPALDLEWARCLVGLRRRILERRGSIAHVRGRDALGDVPLDEASDPVMERLGIESATAARVRDLVASAVHLLVVNPEPLSIVEAARIRALLRATGAGQVRLVVNRASGDGEIDLGELGGVDRIVLPERGGRGRDPEVLDELGEILGGGLP